jgi:AraC-like DNA-binding protein
MLQIIETLFTFGYVLLFGALGSFLLFTKVPKEEGMENYKKSRNTLGSGLIIISIFALTRLFFIHEHDNYIDFWLLVVMTLIHSWLTYSSLLFLMETPRYKIKQFIIDGGLPTSIMIIAGVAGAFFKTLQPTLIVIFGCIFGIKCAWMFYTCRKEFKACKKDLANYYDADLDLNWINGLIWISLIMSAFTIVAFYVTDVHLIYFALIPMIYAYIVMKFMNFMPRKIDTVRHSNTLLEEKPKAEKGEKVKDLVDKIGPKVDKWITEKGFCKPDLNIKDVAMEMGTNQNYLSQYLNNYKGTTFQMWLNTLRIEESKIILTSGEKMSIEEVGIKVGITQSYNFSRWFKLLTGMTPFQFRRQNS